jgi:hypothetical protein
MDWLEMLNTFYFILFKAFLSKCGFVLLFFIMVAQIVFCVFVMLYIGGQLSQN